MASPLRESDWQVRLFIYRFFVRHARPPAISETASHFGLELDDAGEAYQRLNDAHQILLDPGTFDIRMASPLSGIETPFRVHVDGQSLYANCAWDSLGIPAMLKSDATVDSVYTEPDDSHTHAEYEIVDGELCGDGGIVHFPLPVARWYEDLIHT